MTSAAKAKLGLDLDGIVFDFCTAANSVLVTMGYDDPGPWIDWQHAAKACPEGWDRLWDEGIEIHALFDHGAPGDVVYAGAKEFVAELTKDWHVVAVTSRPKSAEPDTLRFLDYLGIDDYLMFPDLKHKYMAGCHVYIEDAPEAVGALWSAGCNVVVFDRPWNAGLAFEGVPRAKSYEEAIKMAREMLPRVKNYDPLEATGEIPAVGADSVAPSPRVTKYIEALEEASSGLNIDNLIAVVEETEESANGPCNTALRLVYGDRQAAYDHPSRDLRRVAAFWSEVFGVPVKPHQVAEAMIALKLSRLIGNPDHEDSEIDVAGWAEVRYRERTFAG